VKTLQESASSRPLFQFGLLIVAWRGGAGGIQKIIGHAVIRLLSLRLVSAWIGKNDARRDPLL
jgi:hypothetical protein